MQNTYLCTDYKLGTVAEWLGRGLQNPVQRFESARYLQDQPEEGRRSNLSVFSLFGVWRSPVARLVRDEKAGGSNPLTPTSNPSNVSFRVMI